VVFAEVGALEISAFIGGKLDSSDRDRRSIGDVYRPAPTTCASVLLAVSGSYINKLISKKLRREVKSSKGGEAYKHLRLSWHCFLLAFCLIIITSTIRTRIGIIKSCSVPSSNYINNTVVLEFIPALPLLLTLLLSLSFLMYLFYSLFLFLECLIFKT
jgi:hypothetical protein